MGDGETCEDVDECADESSNNCDANASCTNTVGAFTCECNDGYQGDGITCAEPDPSDPATHNLPVNYVYSEQSWGRIFHAIPGLTTDYYSAKSKCEEDGAVLPIPRSPEENYFIFHNSYGKVWTGINDQQTEGTYVDNDGEPITWTYWWRTDCRRDFDDTDDCETRDVVAIYGRHWNWMGATQKWSHADTTERHNVVCIKYLDD